MTSGKRSSSAARRRRRWRRRKASPALRASRTLLIVCAAASSAAAETNVVDSIEWATADSDLVVRGTVGHVARHGDVYDLTIAVVDTLKGARRDHVHVGFRASEAGVPEQLRDHHADVLWFLVAGKRLARDDRALAAFDFAPRPLVGATESMILLGTPATRAFTATFAKLDTTDALLAAVRAAAPATATRSFALDAPDDSPAFAELSFKSGVVVRVPVDAALEQRALGWIADRDLGKREAAARVLGYFRSDANIARLRVLLADPGFAMVSVNGGPPHKSYLVRAAAHDALTTWHVAHAAPVIDAR